MPPTNIGGLKEITMKNTNDDLTIEKVPLEQIYDYEKNIKTHDEEQIIAIAQSIDKFGFNNPILVNEKGEIIAGHGRYAAAQLLELDTVPVIRLKHLTDTQARLYRIADNKLSEKGKWDLDMLKIEINELEALTDTSKNLEITDTGFDILEIDSLFVEKEKNE